MKLTLETAAKELYLFDACLEGNFVKITVYWEAKAGAFDDPPIFHW